ncbi:alpha-amylase [Paramicrobacterium humi]|nr:alpha-amylase family protein [Microbacterium humi]
MPRVLRRVMAIALATVAAIALAACSPGPRPANARDVGVQMFQWPWSSLAAECTSFLGPAGYGWVLTSPPNEHITGTAWWTSYQPVSYAVDSRLGTRDEFAAMVGTCHEAGVKVIADAVINHMSGQDEPGTGFAGSRYTHYDYPDLYTGDDFHHCGITPGDDISVYDDAFEVQNCELVNLADLATEKPHVQDAIVAYLDDLLALGVDGFRIDAAKHIPADDIAAIVDRLPEGTFVEQEVIRGAGEPIQPEDYTANGRVLEFGWGRDVKGMIESATVGQATGLGEDWGYLPAHDAVVFVDNHDTERNGETLSYADGAEYLLANVLTLGVGYGTVQLHSGYAFTDRDAGPAQDAAGNVLPATCADDVGSETAFADGDWVCQHRWPGIAGMVSFHNAVGDAPVTREWSEGDAAAWARGDLGFVALNAGAEPITTTLDTGLPAGDYCDVITGGAHATTTSGCSAETVTVDAEGRTTLVLHPMSAVAIHVGARA